MTSSGNLTEYLDEDFYGPDAQGFGQGRKSRELGSTGLESRYTEYWTGTDKVKTKEIYQSGVLQKTQTFLSDGATLASELFASGDVYEYFASANRKSFYNASNQITFYYLDENLNNTHVGHVTSSVDQSGNASLYYLSGNLKSIMTSSGNLTEYLDEDFYGPDAQGFGQGRKSRELSSTGLESRYTEYWTGTDVVQIKDTYQSGVRLATYEYASNGFTLTKETRYRADGSTVSYVIQNGMKIFYVYAGESIQNAINNASAGDVIFLAAGMYNERI